MKVAGGVFSLLLIDLIECTVAEIMFVFGTVNLFTGIGGGKIKFFPLLQYAKSKVWRILS